VRSRVRATLGLAVAVAFATLAGCGPDVEVRPDVEVTSGTVESRAFSSHVEYYDLDLPSDVEGLEWMQLRDWDSNQIYLRFDTDRAGLDNLLNVYQLPWRALKPSQPSSSPALPRESNRTKELPCRFCSGSRGRGQRPE
jgi:hypothetical protein